MKANFSQTLLLSRQLFTTVRDDFPEFYDGNEGCEIQYYFFSNRSLCSILGAFGAHASLCCRVTKDQGKGSKDLIFRIDLFTNPQRQSWFLCIVESEWDPTPCGFPFFFAGDVSTSKRKWNLFRMLDEVASHANNFTYTFKMNCAEYLKSAISWLQKSDPDSKMEIPKQKSKNAPDQPLLDFCGDRNIVVQFATYADFERDVKGFLSLFSLFSFFFFLFSFFFIFFLFFFFCFLSLSLVFLFLFFFLFLFLLFSPLFTKGSSPLLHSTGTIF